MLLRRQVDFDRVSRHSQHGNPFVEFVTKRPLLALIGHGAASDLSPQTAPKRKLTASQSGTRRTRSLLTLPGKRAGHRCPWCIFPARNPRRKPQAYGRRFWRLRNGGKLVTPSGFEPLTLRLGICCPAIGLQQSLLSIFYLPGKHTAENTLNS